MLYTPVHVSGMLVRAVLAAALAAAAGEQAMERRKIADNLGETPA